MAKKIKSKNLTITARLDSKAYVQAVEAAVKKIIDEGVQVQVPLNKVKIKVDKIKTDQDADPSDKTSLILGILVAAAMLFLAWGWWRESQKDLVAEPLVNVTPTPTYLILPTVTPTLKPVKEEVPVLEKGIKIQILNASTNSKKGYWVKNELAEMGFNRVTVGSYSLISGRTEVKYNPRYLKEAEAVAKKVGGYLGVTLSNHYPYSVVVVVGNR